MLNTLTPHAPSPSPSRPLQGRTVEDWRADNPNPTASPHARPDSASTHHAEPAGSAELNGDARLAAMLPAQLLQGGEIVILLLKPSLWYIILAAAGHLAAIAIAACAATWLARLGLLNVTTRDITAVALFIAAVRLLWQLLEWLSRVYVLTDRRIVRVQGVVRVQVFECPLKKIQHTDAVFSLRERLFGLGTLMFSTAGTAVPEAAWVMLAHPLDVHQKVVAAINRYR